MLQCKQETFKDCRMRVIFITVLQQTIRTCRCFCLNLQTSKCNSCNTVWGKAKEINKQIRMGTIWNKLREKCDAVIGVNSKI